MPMSAFTFSPTHFDWPLVDQRLVWKSCKASPSPQSRSGRINNRCRTDCWTATIRKCCKCVASSATDTQTAAQALLLREADQCTTIILFKVVIFFVHIVNGITCNVSALCHWHEYLEDRTWF